MVKRVLTPLTLFSLFSPGIGRRPRHCAGLWASDWLMPRAKQKAWRSNTARPRDWSENTRAGFYPNISLTMWNITSTSLGLHCARWQNHICPPRFWLKLFFREEEREKREADMRREMEERDKQHRETVERLQSQVRLLGPVWIYFTRPAASL